MTRFALAVALLLPQDPVKFESRSAAGDRTNVKIESSLTLEITAKDVSESTSRVLTLDASEEYRQEVLEAAEGSPRKVRVSCPRSSRNKTMAGGTTQSWNTALQGLTFLVTLGADAKVELEGDGELPGGAEAVGAWNAFGRLLSKEPKKAGESWKVEARDVAPALWAGFEDASGQIEVKFDRVEEDRAVLLLAGSLKGATKDGFEGSLELGETTFVFDLKAGRPVSLALSGTLALSKKIVERRPKPGSLTEEIEVAHGEVTVKSTRMTVSVKFE